MDESFETCFIFVVDVFLGEYFVHVEKFQMERTCEMYVHFDGKIVHLSGKTEIEIEILVVIVIVIVNVMWRQN